MKDKETIKKVFELVIQRLEEDKKYVCYTGICVHLSFLKHRELTKEEYETTLLYFRKNKPKSIFFGLFPSRWELSKHWDGTTYWWTRDEEGHNERIKFLQHLIKKAYK